MLPTSIKALVHCKHGIAYISVFADANTRGIDALLVIGRMAVGRGQIYRVRVSSSWVSRRDGGLVRRATMDWIRLGHAGSRFFGPDI